MLGIAALSTALAYIVYFRILAGAGATNVLLVTLLTPATAVFLGGVFLHERLSAQQLIGFTIIALGLAFIDGRLPRALLDVGGNSNLARRNPRPTTCQKSRKALALKRALMATGTRKPIDPQDSRSTVRVPSTGAGI